ncbi:hypothetical protein Tco_1321342 [Tanacetum coccineum]
MTTVDQGMSVEEIERVIAERVANAIEAIAIYETKTNMARKSISQTEQQECKVAENANNKRKWEGNHNGQCTSGEGNAQRSSNPQNRRKGIRSLERTLLGQSARKHMLDLYLCATSANFTIMDRALPKGTDSSHQASCYECGNQAPTGMIARIAKETKTMKTKQSYSNSVTTSEHVSGALPLEEANPRTNTLT